MAVTSLEKGWGEVNNKLCEIFGYPREELIELSWAEITHPDDLKADEAEFERVLAGDIDGYTMDKRFIRKDGNVVYTNISVKCIRRGDGSIEHFVALIQDITERKKIESKLEKHRNHLEELVKERTNELRIKIAERQAADHRFRTVFEQSGSLCMILDPNTTDGIPVIVDANEAACEAHGYAYAQFIGRPVADIDDDEGKRLCLERTQLLLSGKPLRIESTHVRKDGTMFPIAVYADRIDMEGELPLIFTTEHDITERKRLEEELLKTRKLESVSVLAGGIAHDYNNILTALFGNIQLAMLKLPPDHAAYTYMQTASQALKRASSLTQQLLTFATGGDPLLAVVNIEHVLQDSVQFALSGSKTKIALNLTDDLWPVKADKSQLSQAFANLTINARQAMPEGGTLYVETKNIKETNENIDSLLSGDFIQISIRDQGLGISRDHIDKIFDPYFTTKESAHGLGLASVHSIITKHNGHISVDSELGIGTTFTVRLPAERSSPQTIDEHPSSLAEKSRPTLGHVLVMDDEETIRDLSVEMIESFGYTVDAAADGKEALEKYISADKIGNPYDVLIMDLTIPGGMGGAETVKELLSIDPEAKAIVCSGYSNNPVMANHNKHGFRGRLAKPFMMADLEKELSRVLKQH